jgi:hypothetical protein
MHPEIMRTTLHVANGIFLVFNIEQWHKYCSLNEKVTNIYSALQDKDNKFP